MATLKEFLKLEEGKMWDKLMDNPDNDAYKEMSPKFALINMTQKDVYEVSDNMSDLDIEAGFEQMINPNDKVIILDIKNDKIAKRIQ